MFNIEDVIEILAGLRPRIVNIRLDYADKNIIRSLGRQVHKGLALTDRQLDLSIKKIEKYRDGLEKNNIDVDKMLQEKPLKMPLRFIDRSQKIFLSKIDNDKTVMSIKFNVSKEFDSFWSTISKTLIGDVKEKPMLKEIPFNEVNVHQVLSTFPHNSYDIDDEILEIFEKIQEIQENPTNFIPHLILEDDLLVIKNQNSTCQKFIEKNFEDLSKNSEFEFVDKVKSCGILHKSTQVVEKIQNSPLPDLSKKVLLNVSNKLRVNPEKNTLNELFEVIKSLNQWPVLIILEEDADTYAQLLTILENIPNTISNDQVTVFFRLNKHTKNYQEFNDYVKEHKLNNFIDSNTKVVFISKQRIPKPLFKTDWQPYSSIVFSNHDYGKISSYIDNIPVVYYYNNSVSVRNSRIRGSQKIVEL